MCNSSLNQNSNQNSSTLLNLLRFRVSNSKPGTGYTFLSDVAEGGSAAAHLTFAELDRKATLIAAHLQAQNRAGERALLLFSAGLDYIAAFFGCLYAGITAVPVYPPHRTRPDLRLQAILQDAQPTITLATSEIYAERETLTLHNPNLQYMRWLATDTVNPDADVAATRQPYEATPDTLAFLQYTSGSTGNPKGVMLSHGNLLHNLSLIGNSFGHAANSSGVIWLPPFHDMGLIGGLLQALYLGVNVTLMSPVSFLQKPVRWLQAISQTRATTSGGPNFAYDLCVRKITPEQCSGLDLSSWDVAFCGAEPVRAETLDTFAKTFAPYGFRKEAFLPCYGLAEGTLFVSGGPKLRGPLVHSVQEQALTHNKVVLSAAPEAGYQQLVSCGAVSSNQEVIIVNPDTCVRCAADEVGEVWVRGLSVAQGYWNRPEETAQTFHAKLADTGAGPFMRTGDLGFIHEGNLCITGRIKDLIIIRGLNHYPQDIELTVTNCHPALQGSFNAAFTVEIAGEEKLVVITEPDRTQLRKLNLADVVSAVRGAVSAQHALQLHALCLVRPTTLPKTTSGKVQRRATRAAFLNAELNELDAWRADAPQVMPAPNVIESPKPTLQHRPASEIQNWMTRWLAAKMKLPAHAIEPNKPFAEYGLDSLTAAEMAQALSDWLKPAADLKPTLAWDYPTLAVLAAHLAAQVAAPPLPSLPIAQPVVAAHFGPSGALSSELAQELAQLEKLLG